MNQEETLYDVVANYTDVERGKFIRKTYAHVALALFGFIALELIIFNIPGLADQLVSSMFGVSWLLVIGAFFGVTWVAEKLANSSTSLGNQYLGLAVYSFVVSTSSRLL